MNKMRLAVFAGGLLALAPIIPAAAKEMAGPESEYAGHHERHELNLTDDQKTKMKDLRRAERKAMRPLFNKEKDLVDSLKDQVEDKAADAELEKSLAAVKANRQAIREQMEKFRGQREALLTPTQRAQEALEGRKRGHGKHGFGHGGFGEGGDDSDR